MPDIAPKAPAAPAAHAAPAAEATPKAEFRPAAESNPFDDLAGDLIIPEEGAEEGKPEEKPGEKPEEKPPEPAAKKVEPAPELILGRFKTPADLQKSLIEIGRNYSTILQEVVAMQREMGETPSFEDPVVGFVSDPKEMEFVYRDLEKKHTVLTQKRSELRKRLEAKKVSAPTPESDEFEKLSSDQLYDEFLKDPRVFIKKMTRREFDAMLSEHGENLRKQQEEQRTRYESAMNEATEAVKKFAQDHPDFDQLKDEINTIIEKEIPLELKKDSKELLQMAYDMAKGRKNPTAADIEEIKKQARAEAQKEIEERYRAQVESGAGAGAAERPAAKTEDEELRQSILNSGGASSPLL